jgi:hypothetical protein
MKARKKTKDLKISWKERKKTEISSEIVRRGLEYLRNEEMRKKKTEISDKIGGRRRNIHRKEGIKTERFAEGKWRRQNIRGNNQKKTKIVKGWGGKRHKYLRKRKKKKGIIINWRLFLPPFQTARSAPERTVDQPFEYLREFS